MATLVKFRYNEANKDLFAFFPQLIASRNFTNDNGEYTKKFCYSSIGQHSACSLNYVKESRPATESEYTDLKKELESIGYTLRVCK